MEIILRLWHLYVSYSIFAFCVLFSRQKDREMLLDKTCHFVGMFWKKPGFDWRPWRWYFKLALLIGYAILFWTAGIILAIVLLCELFELLGDLWKDRVRKRKPTPSIEEPVPAPTPMTPNVESGTTVISPALISPVAPPPRPCGSFPTSDPPPRTPAGGAPTPPPPPTSAPPPPPPTT